jgi:phosphoribosylformylglycinamidine synthase
VFPKTGQADLEGGRVAGEIRELGLSSPATVQFARGFVINGDFGPSDVERIGRELLADTVIESYAIGNTNDPDSTVRSTSSKVAHVLLKPGVMDPVALSVEQAIRQLGLAVNRVRTFRRYTFTGISDATRNAIAQGVLANDAIEQVIWGPLPPDLLAQGHQYRLEVIRIPIRTMTDSELERVSRTGQLSLNLVEMQTIQRHFREMGRDPTDAELETVAQTWSEHCSHKTLKGRIDYEELDADGRVVRREQFENMLKETVFKATQEIRRALGPNSDWCVSVFEDNAGIVRFDERYNVCFKVETHNHPSAIEPYGGANTGVGGVIRDVIGTGLGAKPIANTDVFCFAPPDWAHGTGFGDDGSEDNSGVRGQGSGQDSVPSTQDSVPSNPYSVLRTQYPALALPPGVLHPKRVMKGVVAGVRDYGNRMGIPTVNGAIYFDDRYLGNPLVFCGNVGLIPRECSKKEPQAGDLIVAVGGRTGRDGIHGATFSSAELTHESDALSGGAVQIGNAITEKMLLDVILAARDRGLYHAITDCGAGGFSSAVGEMGEKIGAEVWLDKAPLKYAGLSYTEIWISEAQERMVLAVPERNWPEFSTLCAREGVEATVIGRFVPTGRLVLKYEDQVVGDLDMHFLHDGRPPVVRKAVWKAVGSRSTVGQQCPDFPTTANGQLPTASTSEPPFNEPLRRILSSWNVCSKEWVIRQYDHEVQGGSVIKPLVGVADDGPSDAAVIRPVLGSNRGLAIACGMNPRYGDIDPYWMAASAIDEAIRNCVAVGADPDRIAILDNFCWGNTDRPEELGSLVRAALACRDIATAYGTPFISGKDSLNNEFKAPDGSRIVIPPTLLISAIGQIDDVRQCVTMDLKRPGNLLYLVGFTADEFGGSMYSLAREQLGGNVPIVDPKTAQFHARRVHEAIRRGLVCSCHDLSEGGLAVALAEMALAGDLGADIDLADGRAGVLARELGEGADADLDFPLLLMFAESNSRFVVEVPIDRVDAFEALMDRPGDTPLMRCSAVDLGVVSAKPRLRIGDTFDLEETPSNGRPTDEALDRVAPLIAIPISELKECWQRPLRW